MKYFRVPEMLGDTLVVWFRRVGPLTAISLLNLVPAFFFSWCNEKAWNSELPDRAHWIVATVVFWVLSMAIGCACGGALNHQVLQALAGSPAPIGDSLLFGVRKLLRVFLVQLLFGLVLTVGFVLLIVPGIILACIFYLAIPVALSEPVGIVEAMNRSRLLTRNHRFRIFLGFCVAAIPCGGVMIAAVLVTLAYFDRGSFLATAIPTLVNATVTPVFVALPCVTYHLLRTRKEGGGAEVLAAMFE